MKSYFPAPGKLLSFIRMPLAGYALLFFAARGVSYSSEPTPFENKSAADSYFGEDRAGLFDSYVSSMAKGHVLSGRGLERLGTTWHNELAGARGRFLAAKTAEDVYYALLSLKNTIHDAHSDLIAPKSITPPDTTLYLPFSLAPYRSSRGVEFTVTGSVHPGIKKGFVLKKYGGKDPGELMREYLEWYRGSSPELREIKTAEWLTQRHSGDHPVPGQETIALVFTDPGSGNDAAVDASFEETDKLSKLSGAAECRPGRFATDGDYSGKKPVFSGLNYDLYSATASGTLVLRFFSFLYDFDSGELWNKTACLSYKPEPSADDGYPLSYRLQRQDTARLADFLRSAAGYDKLLIDLRENRGGSSNENLLSLMAGKPLKTTYRTIVFTPLFREYGSFRERIMRGFPKAMKDRTMDELQKGGKESPPFAFSCLSEECRPGILQNGENTKLNFKFYLLTGPYCVSSCDQFTAIFRDNNLGTQLGLPAQGASAPFRAPYDFTLANGERFSITLNSGVTYRPNGELLEGNPARPDKPVYLCENYLEKILASLR